MEEKGYQNVDDWNLLSCDDGMLLFVKTVYNAYFMTRSDFNMQLCQHHKLCQSVQLPSEIRSIFNDFDSLKEQFPILDDVMSLLQMHGPTMKLLTFLQMCQMNVVSLGLHFILSAKIHVMKIQDLNMEMAALFEELDKMYRFNYYKLKKELELWANASFEIKEEPRKSQVQVSKLRKKIKEKIKYLQSIKSHKKSEYREFIISVIDKTCSTSIFNTIKYKQDDEYDKVRKDLSGLIHQMNYLDEIKLDQIALWKDNDFGYQSALNIFFKLINFRRKMTELQNPKEFKDWMKKFYLKCENEVEEEEKINLKRRLDEMKKTKLKKKKENDTKIKRMQSDEDEDPKETENVKFNENSTKFKETLLNQDGLKWFEQNKAKKNKKKFYQTKDQK
jgi:hypothetical protein